jgi:hypothetical protein
MKKFILLAVFMAMVNIYTQAQDTSIHQYVGKYKFESMEMEATVAIDKEVLTITVPAGTFVLKRNAMDTFLIVDRNSLAEFRRGPDKKVTMLLLYFNNLILEGIKQKDQ